VDVTAGFVIIILKKDSCDVHAATLVLDIQLAQIEGD